MSLFSIKRTVRLLLVGTFLLSSTIIGWRLWSRPLVEAPPHPEVELWIVLGAATSISLQTSQAPLQNVLWATAIVSLAGIVGGAYDPLALVELVAQSEVKGGATTHVGSSVWATPLLWVAVVVNARETARFSLARWRPRPNYGCWTFAATALLAVSLEMSAFAASQRAATFAHAIGPWTHLAVWTTLTIASLALVTPVLINKSPVERGTSVEPFMVWVAINGLVLTGMVLRNAWWPVALLGAEVTALSTCAAWKHFE